jgi:hypothetical protein
MESIKSEKFNKLAKNEIFGNDKIFGGVKTGGSTAVKGNTHTGSSTWLGIDDDNTVSLDALLVPDGSSNMAE